MNSFFINLIISSCQFFQRLIRVADNFPCEEWFEWLLTLQPSYFQGLHRFCALLTTNFPSPFSIDLNAINGMRKRYTDISQYS